MSDLSTSPTAESAPRRPSRGLRVFAVVHLVLMLLGLPILGLASWSHLFMTSVYEETMGYYLAGIGAVVGLWALGSLVGWWSMRALDMDRAPGYALTTLVVGTGVILAPHVRSVVTGIAG